MVYRCLLVLLCATALLATGCGQTHFDPSNPQHAERAEVIAAIGGRNAARAALWSQKPSLSQTEALAETLQRVRFVVAEAQPGGIVEAVTAALNALPAEKQTPLIRGVVLDVVQAALLLLDVPETPEPDDPVFILSQRLIIASLIGAEQACAEYLPYAPSLPSA